MAKTSFCVPRLFFRKRPKPAPAQQGVEKMGKSEGSQGERKPDKGGLGQPLYEPKDGEANVEYACHCILTAAPVD